MKHPFYLVAGLGKTGLSIARFLQRKNRSFAIFDTRKDAPGLVACRSEFPGVNVYLEQIPQDTLSQFTEIIASPGLPLSHPLFKQAGEAGIVVYGDIECLAREIKAPVVAITGTNGKSTVTTLVGEMARASGMRVAVAGNIGTPVLDLLQEGVIYDLWVLELSSFQLDLTHSLQPKVATILNVSSDHLDRYSNLASYAQSKQRIYHHAEHIVYNQQDGSTFPAGSVALKTSLMSFGIEAPQGENWGLIRENDQVFLSKGHEKWLPVASLLIKGVHNWANALASCALAEAAGIPEEHRMSVLKTFSGLPHRCQWVRSLDGVDWINDSKGTNVGATLSAINGIGAAVQGKIVLIAGGQGKGADFGELSQPIADHVRSMVLIGEDADQIEASLAHVVPIFRVSSLDNAVMMAKNQAKPGDVVLLSPACASLDMFRDFNHRGEVFASTVEGL